MLAMMCEGALGIAAKNPQRGLGFAHRQGEDLQRKARPQATPMLSG
jgi:hypothetical protein